MPLNTCHRCGADFEAKTPRTRFCDPCYPNYFGEYYQRARASWTPERRRATGLVTTAIWQGRLTRQPCEVCGATKRVDAHHDDYTKPLEVRWLCKSHHKQHHLKFGPALNAFIS